LAVPKVHRLRTCTVAASTHFKCWQIQINAVFEKFIFRVTFACKPAAVAFRSSSCTQLPVSWVFDFNFARVDTCVFQVPHETRGKTKNSNRKQQKTASSSFASPSRLTCWSCVQWRSISDLCAVNQKKKRKRKKK
jgi:hypothetical protein